MPDLWIQNIRMKLRENGKEYKNIKNQKIEARHMKDSCRATCFHLCTKNFTNDDRNEIFSGFWSLSDKEKDLFYCKFIKRTEVKRKRIQDSTKKKHTFEYYLQAANLRIHRVCKIFFLNTLSIDEKRVYYYFTHLHDQEHGIPFPRKKGKTIKKARDPKKVMEVKAHIETFPVVDSHYCRASSGKKYLESTLTISKMYNLYKQTTQAPVSEWIYRDTFNELNISFLKPKKDQCDRCMQFKNNKNPNAEELIFFEKHKDEVIFLKTERDKDRSNIDEQHLVLL